MQMINHKHISIYWSTPITDDRHDQQRFIVIHPFVSFTCSARRYGYRGTDARRNLWVLPSGELLYYVAAVAVLLDREEDSQRHYTGHTEDIMWCVYTVLRMVNIYVVCPNLIVPPFLRSLAAWTFIHHENW